MLEDTIRIKLCAERDSLPLAGDWGAAGRIHLDQWQSSIRLDQSEPKERTNSHFFICYDNHMMA